MKERGPSILLVDDTPDNLDMMSRSLSRLEVEIQCASSGQEALRLAMETEFAVILMDVQMPVMTGIEAASLLRQQANGTHTPIIFVTAHTADGELIRDAYQLGAVDFLSKPINFHILRSKVLFFVELFRKNQALRLQAEALLEKERHERKLLEERRSLEEHGEVLARLVKELRMANESLGSFASMVSHDLQEPLRGMVGLSDFLMKRCELKLDEQELEIFGMIVKEGHRMQQMIRDMLLLARVGSEEAPKSLVPMDECLRSALENLKSSIKESKATITHGELPHLMFFPPQAVQLFQNLISNAMKFRSKQPPLIHISADKEDELWHFQVKDNGVGLAPEASKTIFLPFRRLHPRGEHEGTGMGLAICQKIVQQAGGTIWVEAAPEEGSIFHFTVAVPSQTP